MAGAGSASFSPTPVVEVLSVAPAGGWVWFVDPRAIHYSGKAYYSYIQGTNGNIASRTVDDDTLTVSAAQTAYPNFDVDDHDDASLLVRASDNFICMAFAQHVGDLYFAAGASAGLLPNSILQVANITSQVGGPTGFPDVPGYTYANLCQFSALADTLYIFYRHHDSGGTARLGWTRSTNNGSTWSSGVDPITVTYSKGAVNGSDRIDFAVGEGPNIDPTASLYHCYYVPSTDKWYRTNGTEITATRPFGVSELTLVYNGSPLPSWVWDIAIESATGYPIIVFAFFHSTTDHRYGYARWNGSTWTAYEIATGGSYLYAAQPYYSGGVSLDHTQPTVVYCSRQVSGQFQIFKMTTADYGVTWSSTQITDDANNNVRPVVIRDHHSSMKVLWLTGTYTSYTSYSEGTSGSSY